MDETFLNGPNDLVMEILRISPNDEEEKKKMLSSTIKNDFSEDSQRKQKIVKNVVLISIAFLINFTSSIGLSVLQSSLHMHKRDGCYQWSSSLCSTSYILSLYTTIDD